MDFKPEELTLLLSMMKFHRANEPFTMKFSDMISTYGTSRNAISGLIKKLKNNGWIKVGSAYAHIGNGVNTYILCKAVFDKIASEKLLCKLFESNDEAVKLILKNDMLLRCHRRCKTDPLTPK